MNKRIYILSSAIGLAGGADKATKLLAEVYQELGFNITVFATSCEVVLKQKNIDSYGPLIKYVYRWKLPQLSLIIRLLFFSVTRKPNFIHCVGLTYEVKLALSYLNWCKIIVWETTEADSGNRFVEKGIIPKLKYAHLMLAPSETIKRNILANYCYNGPIEILPFWTEWQTVQNTHKMRSYNLLYVGRMDQDKGFDCLFHALRSIKNIINIQVEICGRGNVNLIKEMAYDLPNVKFYGFLSNKKIEELYNRADFVVLPSKHEGYPLSLIEACGKSIPIIASNVGSIPEVYQDSKAGFIFNANNNIELTNCLLNAYRENEETYQRRRVSARKLYEKINNISIIKNKIQEIIKIIH